MVLFIRDNECFEPRVRNYIRYFQENGIAYQVLAWNRNGDAKPEENILFYERRAEYGKRIANIPNKLLWMWFVVRNIYRYRKKCTAIHACDIDAILPALFMGKLLRKKVIFDIFDWISSLTGKGAVYRIVEGLQNYCYGHSDYVILCEEERKKQAKVSNDSVFVLPNIPQYGGYDRKAYELVEKEKQNYRMVISYVGIFDKDRGLEDLLESVSASEDVLLNIAGFGLLDEWIRGYSEKKSNIKYWGRVGYEVGQAIMKNSDIIAAMYYLTSPLHKYAAPNKYYESLLHGIPLITTENTLVGEKTLKYDTGFVLPEGREAIDSLLEKEDLKELIGLKKKNCQETWKNVYKEYVKNFMENKYLKMIQ